MPNSVNPQPFLPKQFVPTSYSYGHSRRTAGTQTWRKEQSTGSQTSECISCLAWKILRAPREKGASLVVPGKGLRPSACICPCGALQHPALNTPESKTNSKEPQESFFSERRKPSHGKSPLETTYFLSQSGK